LRLKPAVERRGDIDRGANGILLHEGIISRVRDPSAAEAVIILPRLRHD
jgi:hypothetical protein